VLGAISLLGACYLIYLGIENLRVKIDGFEVDVSKKDALRRGIITNLLSPHLTYFGFLLAVRPFSKAHAFTFQQRFFSSPVSIQC
jgi:threonine/homoserine/homoserine lactone efflux protein